MAEMYINPAHDMEGMKIKIHIASCKIRSGFIYYIRRALQDLQQGCMKTPD